MRSDDSASIKAQEWIVRFDGTIKQSEEIIDSESHHREINNSQKEEDHT